VIEHVSSDDEQITVLVVGFFDHTDQRVEACINKFLSLIWRVTGPSKLEPNMKISGMENPGHSISVRTEF
jgi:hypothetical protein